MRYNTRYSPRNFFPSGRLPDGVKWLLISNIAIFVLSYLAAGSNLLAEVFPWLALRPDYVVHHFAIWQLGTYLFLHGGFLHLGLNMLTLWMFGVILEKDWGTRQFLKYYFICGIGAGLCDVVVNALLGNWGTSTIGASGAIYGLLLAFGVMYPETEILFKTAREFFFSPLVELGPLSGWKRLAGAGDDMQDAFFFTKEAIDHYFKGRPFAVTVVGAAVWGRKRG